ncbi:MAG: outer membrane beta-barrel protein [Bacteroidota bacterium]
MKKFIFQTHTVITLMALMLTGPFIFAQSEEDEKTVEVGTDTTEIAWKNRKLIIIADEDGRRFEIKEVDRKDTDEEADERREKDHDYDHDDDVDEYEEDDYDGYEPDYDKKTKRSRKSGNSVDLLAFDLGITNYYVDGLYGADAATPEMTLKDFRPGSHVALHLFPTQVSLIGRGAIYLKTAVTVDWNNYYYVNDITPVGGEDGITFSDQLNDQLTAPLEKNKMMVRYAQIPLLIGIDTRPRSDGDGLRVSVGGYAGVLWKARTKQVDENNIKVKTPGTFNLNPIRYGLTARVDFGWFDIYLNYNLSELFLEGEGPLLANNTRGNTQTFTAGINIIHF